MTIDEISPNLPHYLLVFSLIVVMRFFKLLDQVKEKKVSKKHYLFVALEFVYASLGIVLTLQEINPTLTNILFAVYLFLVAGMSMFEMKQESFGDNTKLFVNITVISIVVGMSFYVTQTVMKPKSTATSSPPPITQHAYRVAIPYTDLSVQKFIGDRFGGRRLVYVADVRATTREEAIRIAKDIFWDPDNIQVVSFDPKKQKNRNDILIDAEGIVVESYS